MPIDETTPGHPNIQVVSHCPEENRVLQAWCERRPLPRPFAVVEVLRDAGRLVTARPRAWGIDLTENKALGEATPGAVFVSPQGTYGNASSAESTRNLFARIRDVRLVWL